MIITCLISASLSAGGQEVTSCLPVAQGRASQLCSELELFEELLNNTDTWALPKANYWKFLADGAHVSIPFKSSPDIEKRSLD